MMNRKELIRKLNRPINWVAIFAGWTTVFLMNTFNTDPKLGESIAITALFLTVVLIVLIMLGLKIWEKSVDKKLDKLR